MTDTKRFAVEFDDEGKLLSCQHMHLAPLDTPHLQIVQSGRRLYVNLWAANEEDAKREAVEYRLKRLADPTFGLVRWG